MRIKRYAIALILLLAPGLSACRRGEQIVPRPVLGADIVLEREFEILTGRVPLNGTLDALLRAHALSGDLARRVVDVARGVFNPRLLRVGQPYQIVVSFEGFFRRFEYEIDRDRFLRIVSRTVGVEAGEPEELTAEILSYPKSRILLTMSGGIDRRSPSLVAAIGRAGEEVGLALALADVFAAQVDFNSDLQPGDAFDVVFEKEYRDEAFSGYGNIMAATFVNNGRRLQAFRFAGPDGRAAYYDENGSSVKRFFLSSPLPFTPRVTSRFSRSRMHPVLGVARAHLGVDYAAPVGTPVIAVADGVVVSAAYNGASGRMVRLRHANGYHTYYLHLSAFAKEIRPGARVAQGQVIGRVGATGVVTGPHLDYRLSRGGVFVNPITEQRRLPPGDPVPEEARAQFEAARDAALAVMGQATAEAAPLVAEAVAAGPAPAAPLP
ncbi:MAG: M23 family metallopeptidase [Gemmatimonadetes bacterium]|nr:M23 family metallopeptidase [Gemmatimonadota bacterium]